MIDKLVIVLIIAFTISILAYGVFFKNFFLMFLKSILGGLIGGTLNEILLNITNYRIPTLIVVASFSILALITLNKFWIKILYTPWFNVFISKKTAVPVIRASAPGLR